MEFVKLWEILLRRKWVVLYIFFFFSATIIVGIRFVTPTYKATTKLFIDENSQTTWTSLLAGIGLQGVGAGGQTKSSSSYTYDTEIQLMKIRPLLEQIIKEFDLRDRKGVVIKPEKLTDIGIIDKILNKLSPQPYVEVDQYENADMLELSCYAQDATISQKMANRLSNLYIDDGIWRTRQEYMAAKLSIENQMKSIKEEYYRSLNEIKNFQEKEGIVDLTKETDLLISKLFTLRTNYEDNEKSLIEERNKMAAAERKLRESGQYRKSSEEFSENDVLETLKNKLNDTIISLSGKGADITAEHPDYKQLLKQIDMIKEMVKNEASLELSTQTMSVDPIYDNLIKIYTDAFVESEVAIAKRKLFQNFINSSEKELFKLPSKMANYSKLELKLSLSKDMYSKMLEYLNQVGIVESMSLSNIKLVEPAETPEKVYYPNKKLMYFLAIFLGILFGFVAALFMEYIDHTIKKPDDLKNIAFMPFLGSIAFMKYLKKNKTISKANPKTQIVEAFRTIKNSISYTSIDKPVKTIVIASTIPSEGKSSIAANMSIIYTKEDKKVLLVEMNLRIPSVHTLFGTGNSKGLTNVLVGGMELKEAITPSGTVGLDLITSGPVPPDPIRLIESKKIKEILDTLKAKYDIIIIDTPSIISVNDAVVIGTSADGMLYIIEPGKITFSMMEHTSQLIKKAGINVLGVVFNKVKGYNIGYYNKYY